MAYGDLGRPFRQSQELRIVEGSWGEQDEDAALEWAIGDDVYRTRHVGWVLKRMTERRTCQQSPLSLGFVDLVP